MLIILSANVRSCLNYMQMGRWGGPRTAGTVHCTTGRDRSRDRRDDRKDDRRDRSRDRRDDRDDRDRRASPCQPAQF